MLIHAILRMQFTESDLYREAIELAFMAQRSSTQKTLQPLQRKEIPLYVKSFINPC
jgi:aspartokinase